MAGRVNVEGNRVRIPLNYDHARPVVGDCCPCGGGGGGEPACQEPPDGFCAIQYAQIPPGHEDTNCYNVVTLEGTTTGNDFTPFGYSRDFEFLGGLPHYVEGVSATNHPQVEDKTNFEAAFSIDGWKIIKRGNTGVCYSAASFFWNFTGFGTSALLQCQAIPVDPFGNGLDVGDLMPISHIATSGGFQFPAGLLEFYGSAEWLPDDTVHFRVTINGQAIVDEIRDDGFRCGPGGSSASFGQFTSCGSTPPPPTADIFFDVATFAGQGYD